MGTNGQTTQGGVDGMKGEGGGRLTHHEGRGGLRPPRLPKTRSRKPRGWRKGEVEEGLGSASEMEQEAGGAKQNVPYFSFYIWRDIVKYLITHKHHAHRHAYHCARHSADGSEW